MKPAEYQIASRFPRFEKFLDFFGWVFEIVIDRCDPGPCAGAQTAHQCGMLAVIAIQSDPNYSLILFRSRNDGCPGFRIAAVVDEYQFPRPIASIEERHHPVRHFS